ncbi:hypothetical protein GQ42DRAFT_181151 [Ramicandelaber brevisporus]|nr:hypothetical protein GQ42DRAFT_181151 [Ramicandelaber brevisporus]
MESLAVQYCERYRKFLVALLGWGSEHGLAAAHGMFKLDRLPDEQLGVLAADVYDELGRRTSSDGRPAHAAPTFPTTAPVGSPEFTQQTLRNQSKMKLASLSPKRMTELVSDLVHEFEARYPHVLGGRGGARPPGQSTTTTTTTTTTTHAAGLPTPPSVLGPQPSPRQPVPQQSSSSSSTMSPQHQPGLATPYLRYDVKTAMALNSASIASPPLLPTSPYQHSHYPGPVAGLSSPGVRPFCRSLVWPGSSATNAFYWPVHIGSNAAGAGISRSDTPSSPASSMAVIHSTGGPINGQQASTPVSLPPPPSTMFSQSSASNTHSSAHSQSSSLLTRNPSTPATAALTGRILPPAPPRPSIPPPPSSSYPHTLQRPTANPLSPNNNPQQQQQQQQHQQQLPTSPHVAALSPTMPFQVRPPPPLSPTDSVVWSSPGGAIGAISSPASHPQQPPTTTLVNANEHARAPNIANLFGKGHPQHHQRQHQNPQTAQSQQSQQPSSAAAVAATAGVHSGNPPVPLSNPYSYHPTSYGTFPYHSTAPSGMPVRPLPPAAVTAPTVGAVTTGHPRAPPTATTVTSNAQTSSAESNSALDELKKEYNQQISDLQTQLEAVNSRLIEEIGRADNAETLLSDVVTKSKEDADETSSIFSDSSSRRDTVPPEILDLRRINAQQQQRLERSQREIAELNTVLSSTRQRLQDTIAKTAEARAEADRLRQQIAELQRENEQLLDDDERHTEKYKRFVEEIRVLEQDLEKARRDARKYRTISVYGKEHSYGDILHLKGLISVDGVLDARFLQSFQHTVDQLLIEARSSDPESIGELAHSVSLIVQNIIDSIESFGNSNLDGINTLIVSAQQLRTTRGRLSAASAELVRAAARYAQGFGISPVSLLEGAASQLATEVLESAKLLKVKPSLQAARAVGSGLHHHQQVEEDNDNRSPPGVSTSVSHPSVGAAPSGPDSLPDLAEFVKARSADVAVNIQTLIAVTRNNNINPVDLHQSLQQLSDGLGKVVNASRNVLLPLAHASANGSPASNILAQFSGFSVDVAQKSLEGISESYVQLGNIMNELQNTALGILGANEVEEKRLLSKLFSSGNSASSKTTGGRKRAATALRNHRTFAAPAVQDLVNNKNYKRKLTATILEVAKSLGALFQQLETTTSSAPAQTV